MVLASEVEEVELRGADGAVLGSVVRVLYHPEEPRVIGLMVRGPAIYGVVQRGDTFLPLSGVSFEDGRVTASVAKLPTGRKAADGLGFDPDTTVIWTGMPVEGPSGREIGVITDVEFDPADGSMGRVEVAGGAIADTAHGRFLVPAGATVGYRDGVVHVTLEAGELETSGGLARSAAHAVVAVGEAAREAGAAAERAIVDASHATGRAIKAVREAQVAERAVEAAGQGAKRARNTWRDTMKAFREGMRGEDD